MYLYSLWCHSCGKSWDGYKYKNWNILRTEHNFLRNKKSLNLCLRWQIFRSYRFVVEVTFKYFIGLWKILFHWTYQGEFESVMRRRYCDETNDQCNFYRTYSLLFFHFSNAYISELSDIKSFFFPESNQRPIIQQQKRLAELIQIMHIRLGITFSVF